MLNFVMVKNLIQSKVWLVVTFFFFLLCIALFLHRKNNHNDIIINMYYPDAREIIIQSGWKAAENLPVYRDIGLSAKFYRDKGYSEIEECSGSGIELCNFYFQNKKGEYLRIGTEGEFNNLHTYPRIIYAKIFNFPPWL